MIRLTRFKRNLQRFESHIVGGEYVYITEHCGIKGCKGTYSHHDAVTCFFWLRIIVKLDKIRETGYRSKKELRITIKKQGTLGRGWKN